MNFVLDRNSGSGRGADYRMPPIEDFKGTPEPLPAKWSLPYDVLRDKWGTVPYDAQNRLKSRELLQLNDQELLTAWENAYNGTSTNRYFGIRGWYHDLYRHRLSGLKILDLGCGLGVSSIHFAEHGARLIFADIVEDNIRVVERLCALKRISAEFLYIENTSAFLRLSYELDAVLAIGSLINAPKSVIREEVQAVLPHLKTDGLWLHLAYPKIRWERDGMPPFANWGEMTDGAGTPWMEYHEWETLVELFSPTPIELAFDCEWHNHDFNWFEFRIRRGHTAVSRLEPDDRELSEHSGASLAPVHSEPGPSPFAMFLEPEALRINSARQTHLSTLGLDLEGKRVLEVGAGIGLHTAFFEERGCDVLSTDANAANVAEMLRRYAHRRVGILDLDRAVGLTDLGRFDIIYCYGTLYHLRDPEAALVRLAEVCSGQILIETIVSRGELPEIHHVVEPLVPNQAIQGIGCRPTRPWVISALRRHFGHAYTALDQPDYPDFVTDWETIEHCGNLRAVFIGSKCSLMLPSLTASLPKRHRNAPMLSSARRPTKVWIDVGAYRGDASLDSAIKDPRLIVHAFEPVPALCEALADRPSNYILHSVAVSDRNGMAPFHINRFAAASSLLALDDAARRAWIEGDLLGEECEIVVPTIRLDTFMNESNIAEVEFLKIDAQGADFMVVQSAGERLRDIIRIKLEVAVTPRQLYIGAADKATIVDFLQSRGFALSETQPQSQGQEENLTFVRV